MGTFKLTPLTRQFDGLHQRHPGQWPLAPRLLCGAGVMAGVVVLGHVLCWSGQFQEQETGRQQEASLRFEYQRKMALVVNLEALRAQKVLAGLYVERLRTQLPGKAEMAALLSEISEAGLGRSLQFELFKPGQVNLTQYYAELPIDLKVTGSYHDIAAFASDLARLPRIVTLDNLRLSIAKDGHLTLEAMAKTFRYLEPQEMPGRRKASINRKAAAS